MRIRKLLIEDEMTNEVQCNEMEVAARFVARISRSHLMFAEPGGRVKQTHNSVPALYGFCKTGALVRRNFLLFGKRLSDVPQSGLGIICL